MSVSWNILSWMDLYSRKWSKLGRLSGSLDFFGGIFFIEGDSCLGGGFNPVEKNIGENGNLPHMLLKRKAIWSHQLARDLY